MASLRGLWPEVHRAWASFDDVLLVWDYEAPKSAGAVAATPPLGHPITAAVRGRLRL